MLYTSVPLERVYYNFREANQVKAGDGAKAKGIEGEDDFKEVMLKHGRLVTKRDGDHYVIQKVYSTDMGDYLKDQYAPGSIYKE
jgi:hypothetical protein